MVFMCCLCVKVMQGKMENGALNNERLILLIGFILIH